MPGSRHQTGWVAQFLHIIYFLTFDLSIARTFPRTAITRQIAMRDVQFMPLGPTAMEEVLTVTVVDGAFYPNSFFLSFMH